MKASAETRNSFEPVFEDAESGLDIESISIDQVQACNMVREASMYDGTMIYKPTLPKGSTTFQQVIDEIEKEKEAEKLLIEKALNAFATVKKKPPVKTDNKNVSVNRWKMTSMRMRSQRDLFNKQ